MRLRDWPIARRITAALILLTITVAFTIQITGFVRGAGEFRRLTFATQKKIAAKTARSIDDSIRRFRGNLRVLALNPAVIDLCQGGARPPAESELTARIDHDPALALLLIANPKGEIIASSTKEVKLGTSIKDRPYFAPALGGKTHVTGLLRGRLGFGVYFSQAVMRADRLIGIVVLKVNGDRIDNMIDAIGVGTWGYAELGERIGRDRYVVIASRHRTQKFTSDQPLTEPMQAVAEKRWGQRIVLDEMTGGAPDDDVFEGQRDGESWMGAVASTIEMPWRVRTFMSREEFQSSFRSLIRDQLIFILGVLIFAGVVAYFLARTILRPVRTLTETAELIADGHLEARSDITTDDELGRLARVFDQMVPRLAESVKLQESLAVAGTVQRDLLPKTPPDFPGLDVFGANDPYEQIGGDYFDFLDLRPWGDERLAAVVGDVVGHGIGAALLMATARAHVRSRAQPLPELGALFNEINLRLSADLGEEQFMTLALYAFDAKNGRLDWTSAGQDAAFHYREQTGEIEEVVLKNVPLGVLPDWEYKAGSRQDLARGDVLLIGTDGIWETRNKEREEFGKERVRNLLQMNRQRSAQELVEAVFGAVERFRGELPRQDDVTLVAIRIV